MSGGRRVFVRQGARCVAGLALCLGLAAPALAAGPGTDVTGIVRDETGGALPGVSVELRDPSGAVRETVSDAQGQFVFQNVPPGAHKVGFGLVNFAGARRDILGPGAGTVRVEVALHLALSADVTVTGKRTFTNLADAADPAQDLIGIAQSASQGAITARQLDARLVMRAGEVLETVPGVVISQHSGEGKANQYYLRGFNLDHGTDFATTVAGMPVNMPTHAHGQGYSDANFLIPELVSGVQFSKGPYYGFHSNDARGATISVDPSTGSPADRVTPLVRAKGAEIGLRTVAVPHLQTSVSLWTLSLDSELIFVGDAGTTEGGRPSHRAGVEIANYYTPKPWLIFDGDVSLSRARFSGSDPAGSFIPGAAETVVSAGVSLDTLHRLFGTVRLRYFGPRALVEDHSVRSKATSLANAEIGFKVSRTVRLALDVFNLLDARDSDIDYFYTSRLPGEPAAGIDDIHFHATLPRTARLSLMIGF